MTLLEAVDRLDALAALRRRVGATITVCIPARDEMATVAGVVEPVVTALVGNHAVVEEVLVVDDGSDDGTGAVAGAAGARVVRRSDGSPGKGAAMAVAVAESSGDIVVFLDADVTNDAVAFVAALVEPLLLDTGLMMVKGTYRRSLAGVAGEGGRVTELLARPLLEQLVPEVAFLRQPLAGEVAVRRSALEGLVLDPGYGVEIGMVIDVARRFGAASIGQVELGERVHRNRPLSELGGQAREVLAAVLART